MQHVRVVDSHTGGEPTRVVISGGPELGNGTLAERVTRFRAEYDWFRSAVVNEPRGSDVIVGALLCEPLDRSSAAAVIFFNNVGYLGMCGHGTIGLVVSLKHLGRLGVGGHQLETPAGAVTTTLHPSGEVTVSNVHSYRKAAKVSVAVPGFGTVCGDVAWGGNWFFLIEDHGFDLSMKNVERLTSYAWAVRQALKNAGISGDRGQEIDHIELFAPSAVPGVNSKNFVLCPGKAYDRSPCGTGTSAKLACLYADGQFGEGQTWRQEGIVGTVFEGRIKLQNGQVYPSITGSAYVNGEADLLLDPRDPFCCGIRG
ncbi:MAG: proline racemase family protein [Acidobacteria bacterium]|nr:proline racemase family protein [Acidobacteriota bacterium]MBV9624153.1 proline racemase family protein [Acidobacteriota bacterium]